MATVAPMRGVWYAARQVTAALVVGDKDGNRSGKQAPPNNVRMNPVNPYIYMVTMENMIL